MTHASYQAPLLIDPRSLDACLGDPALRLFDATTVLRKSPRGGPYTVISGRAGYNRGHIPGAAFADIPSELSAADAPHIFTLPASREFADRAARLGIGDDTYVVVYSQTSPMWATRLWWLLRYFGFDRVSVLDGGLPDWRTAQLPISTTSVTYPAATLTLAPRRSLLATRGEVELIVRGEASGCLLNALIPESFRGEGISSYSRPGRIPGSINVPWSDLLSGDTHRFRPLDELVSSFAHCLSSDEPIVAYCGAGISATVDIFALALAGRHDIRLYDGSLAEWTADPKLPLECG